MIDDVGGGEFDVEQAAIVEAGGVGVAVDGAGVVEIVVRGDGVTALPVEEVEFDVFAVLVVADFAFAGVTVERRRLLRFGLK